MFEMLCGEELGCAVPDAGHYRAINNALVVEVSLEVDETTLCFS